MNTEKHTNKEKALFGLQELGKMKETKTNHSSTQEIEMFMENLKKAKEEKEELKKLNENKYISLMLARYLDNKTEFSTQIFMEIFEDVEELISEFTIERSHKEYNQLLAERGFLGKLPNPKYIKFSQSLKKVNYVLRYPMNEARKFLLEFTNKHYASTKDFFSEEISEKAFFITGKLVANDYKVDVAKLTAPTNVYKEHPFFPFLSNDKDNLKKEIKETIKNMNMKQYQKMIIEKQVIEIIDLMNRQSEKDTSYQNEELVKYHIMKGFDKKYKEETEFVIKNFERMKPESIDLFAEKVNEKDVLFFLSNGVFKNTDKKINFKNLFDNREKEVNSDVVLLEYLSFLMKEDKNKAMNLTNKISQKNKKENKEKEVKLLLEILKKEKEEKRKLA